MTTREERLSSLVEQIERLKDIPDLVQRGHTAEGLWQQMHDYKERYEINLNVDETSFWKFQNAVGLLMRDGFGLDFTKPPPYKVEPR
jgi:hypothetical protein